MFLGALLILDIISLQVVKMRFCSILRNLMFLGSTLIDLDYLKMGISWHFFVVLCAPGVVERVTHYKVLSVAFAPKHGVTPFSLFQRDGVHLILIVLQQFLDWSWVCCLKFLSYLVFTVVLIPQLGICRTSTWGSSKSKKFTTICCRTSERD